MFNSWNCQINIIMNSQPVQKATKQTTPKPAQETSESIIKQLNEAELILSTALYQSKQKLDLIKKANSRPVFSEDLIRYAHSISSQHSVASPMDWNPGDPRRPYPTDLQMRLGLLSGNAPTSSDSSPFHFMPPGSHPGAGAAKKVNIEEKDVDLMSTDSSSSSSSDSQ